MKLLFDQQLSPKLVLLLSDLFPGSRHVHEAGLGTATDHEVWNHARDQGLTLVTKDADFADFVTVWGPPPRVIWVRLGNCTTEAVERLLRTEYDAICHMHEDPALGLLTVG